MITIQRLPIQINKSDLEELFSPYGKILKIEQDERCIFVQLDKEENEKAAIRQLDRTRWRGYILHLDPIRGNGIKIGQPEGEDSTQGNGSKVGQPGSGGSQK